MLSKNTSEKSSLICKTLGCSLLIQYGHWEEQGDRIIERKTPLDIHYSQGRYKQNLIAKTKDSPSKSKLSLKSSKVLACKQPTILGQNIMEGSSIFSKNEKSRQKYSEQTSHTNFFDNTFANKTLKKSNFFSKCDMKNVKDQQNRRLYNNASDEINTKLNFGSQVRQIVDESGRTPVSDMKTRKILKIIKQVQNTGRSGNTSKYENDEDIQVSDFYSHQGIGEEYRLDLQENIPLGASIALKKKTTKRFHRILELDCKSANSIEETQSDHVSEVISDATIFDSIKDHSQMNFRKNPYRHCSLINHFRKDFSPLS